MPLPYNGAFYINKQTSYNKGMKRYVKISLVILIIIIGGYFILTKVLVNTPGDPGTSSSALPEVGCTDSDGGKDYYVKGTTSNTGYVKDEGIKTFFATDGCWPPPYAGSNNLAEQYCIGDGAFVITYKCPNGCLDGACIK